MFEGTMSRCFLWYSSAKLYAFHDESRCWSESLKNSRNYYWRTWFVRIYMWHQNFRTKENRKKDDKNDWIHGFMEIYFMQHNFCFNVMLQHTHTVFYARSCHLARSNFGNDSNFSIAGFWDAFCLDTNCGSNASIIIIICIMTIFKNDSLWVIAFHFGI